MQFFFGETLAATWYAEERELAVPLRVSDPPTPEEEAALAALAAAHEALEADPTWARLTSSNDPPALVGARGWRCVAPGFHPVKIGEVVYAHAMLAAAQGACVAQGPALYVAAEVAVSGAPGRPGWEQVWAWDPATWGVDAPPA